MGRSPIDWVPRGAWLTPGYAEWAPPAALRGAVACLWARVSPEGTGQSDRSAQSGLVLPDACSDLIWERGVGGYVAGPDTGPARPMIQPGTVIVGVRFRPSAGGQVLKTPLSEIANQRVPLADLLPPAARRLSPTLDPAEAAGQVPTSPAPWSPTAPPTGPWHGPPLCCETRPRGPRWSRPRSA
jgi:hypothetical protein